MNVEKFLRSFLFKSIKRCKQKHPFFFFLNGQPCFVVIYFVSLKIFSPCQMSSEKTRQNQLQKCTDIKIPAS